MKNRISAYIILIDENVYYARTICIYFNVYVLNADIKIAAFGIFSCSAEKRMMVNNISDDLCFQN